MRGYRVGAYIYDGFLLEKASIPAIDHVLDEIATHLAERWKIDKDVIRVEVKDPEPCNSLQALLEGSRQIADVFDPAEDDISLHLSREKALPLKSHGIAFDWGVRRWFVPRGVNKVPFRAILDSHSLCFPPPTASSSGRRSRSVSLRPLRASETPSTNKLAPAVPEAEALCWYPWGTRTIAPGYLRLSYSPGDSELIKACGGHCAPKLGRHGWWVVQGEDMRPFAQWLPTEDGRLDWICKSFERGVQANLPESSAVPVPLPCPFQDKEKAKALGAGWDPAKRKWVVPCCSDLRLFGRWLSRVEAGDTLPPPADGTGTPAVLPSATPSRSQGTG